MGWFVRLRSGVIGSGKRCRHDVTAFQPPSKSARNLHHFILSWCLPTIIYSTRPFYLVLTAIHPLAFASLHAQAAFHNFPTVQVFSNEKFNSRNNTGISASRSGKPVEIRDSKLCVIRCHPFAPQRIEPYCYSLPCNIHLKETREALLQATQQGGFFLS